jgi:hypothetical protein
MTDSTGILLTACATVGVGTVVYWMTRFVFDPVAAMRKSLGDISYCLQYHAWVFHMGRESIPPERLEKVFDELRSGTARLRADANQVFAYDFFAEFGVVPKHDDLIDASGRLIRISNSLGRDRWDQMTEDLDAVESLLRIDTGRPNYKRDARAQKRKSKR